MNDGENGAGEALQKTEITQEEHLRIGFRTMQFDPVRGFLLNGRKVRMNGAAITMTSEHWERLFTKKPCAGNLNSCVPWVSMLCGLPTICPLWN